MDQLVGADGNICDVIPLKGPVSQGARFQVMNGQVRAGLVGQHNELK